MRNFVFTGSISINFNGFESFEARLARYHLAGSLWLLDLVEKSQLVGELRALRRLAAG